MAFKFVVLCLCSVLILGEAQQIPAGPPKSKIDWIVVDRVVDETIDKVHTRIGDMMETVINDHLDDRTTTPALRECIHVCKDSYAEVYLDVAEVLQDFKKTRDFTMASDYLANQIGLNFEPCKRCMNNLFKGENGINKFSDSIQLLAKESTEQIDKLLHP